MAPLIPIPFLGLSVTLVVRASLRSNDGQIRFFKSLSTLLLTCIMLNRAVSTFFGDAFTLIQARLISLGAFFFWLSDLALAINRFRCPFRLEALGLYLYDGGVAHRAQPVLFHVGGNEACQSCIPTVKRVGPAEQQSQSYRDVPR